MENKNLHHHMDKPLGITLLQIQLAGSFLFGGCKEVQMSISNPDQPCLVPVSTVNPLVGKLHNLSALLYFIILIVYALFLFPKTHMDVVTGEKMFMGRQKKKRNVAHYFCGGIMTASLLLIIAYIWFLGNLIFNRPFHWINRIT